MEEELKKIHDEILENLKEAFGERLDGAVGDIDPRLMDRWIVTTNPDPILGTQSYFKYGNFDDYIEKMKECYEDYGRIVICDISVKQTDKTYSLKSGFSTKYVANIQMFAYSYKRDANDTEGCTNE